VESKRGEETGKKVRLVKIEEANDDINETNVWES
jgi:hypothetical protein